uniref:Uncharacterized protein n=1 Tax=Opuntia streptacantha TaxID=393608 RepID=A0A7C8Z3G9_OPUST
MIVKNFVVRYKIRYLKRTPLVVVMLHQFFLINKTRWWFIRSFSIINVKHILVNRKIGWYLRGVSDHFSHNIDCCLDLVRVFIKGCRKVEASSAVAHQNDLLALT